MTAYVLDRESAKALRNLCEDEAAFPRALASLRASGFLVEAQGDAGAAGLAQTPLLRNAKHTIGVFRPVEL